MRSSLAPLALAVLAVPVRGQEPSGPPDDLLERRVVLSVPGMDRVQVRRDLTYTGGDSPLRMDLYLPPGAAPKTGWPVVVLVHGGPVPSAWRPKDWGVFRSYGELISLDLLTHASGRHGFDILDDDDRSREIIRRTLAFLRESLSVP